MTGQMARPILRCLCGEVLSSHDKARAHLRGEDPDEHGVAGVIVCDRCESDLPSNAAYVNIGHGLDAGSITGVYCSRSCAEFEESVEPGSSESDSEDCPHPIDERVMVDSEPVESLEEDAPTDELHFAAYCSACGAACAVHYRLSKGRSERRPGLHPEATKRRGDNS